MGVYITETWLRETYPLQHGSTVVLPEDARLTPAAQGLLDDRRIVVRFGDTETPEESRDDRQASSSEGEGKRVNPLTGRSDWDEPCCQMCQQTVHKKPDTLTHLDGRHLVSKNDPRLRFRGKVDTAIAHAVLVQAEFDPEKKYPVLAAWIADIRSLLGYVLRAEVTGEVLPPLSIGGLDEEAIHKISHNPLKHLGHDHIVPAVEQGLQVARLNLLRAQIREVEMAAAEIFIVRDFHVERPDIMATLNRLSSAVYILMVLVLVAERGQAANMESLKHVSA